MPSVHYSRMLREATIPGLSCRFDVGHALRSWVGRLETTLGELCPRDLGPLDAR